MRQKLQPQIRQNMIVVMPQNNSINHDINKDLYEK